MRFKLTLILTVFFLVSNASYLFCIDERYMSYPGPQNSSYSGYIVPMGADNIIHWPNLNHEYDPDNYWEEFSKDIDWYLNEDDAKDLTFNQVKNACESSFNTWEGPSTTNVNFVYKGSTSATFSSTDNKNVLFWAGTNDPIFTYIGSKAFFAVTLVSFDSDEELFDVDIAFNDWESPYNSQNIPIEWTIGTNEAIPNLQNPTLFKLDVQTVATHEIGHLLGLHHFATSGAVMTGGWEPGLNHDLETDDIIGASFLCGGKIIESFRQFNPTSMYEKYYFDWPISIVSGATLKFRADYQEFPEFHFTTYEDEFCLTVENGGEFICDSYSKSSGSCVLFLGGKNISDGLRILDGGTATIDNSWIGDGFFGICLCQSGELDLQNCGISNCSNGIFLNYMNFSSQDPVIKNNNIDYCGSGLFFNQSGGTGSNIQNNVVENCDYGIKFLVGSSPVLTSSQNHNKIKNNDYGLYAWLACSPFFSYNNIENSSVYAAKATYSSHLTAENNYWGTSDPSYYVDGSSSFDFLPKLSGPLSKSISSGLSNDIEIEQLKNLIYANEIDAAKVKCKEIISQFSDLPKSIAALSLLWELSRRDDVDQFKNYLTSLSSHKEKKDINGIAEMILAGYYTDTKILKIDNIYKKYNSENVKQLALYTKYCHYLLEENDRKKAQKIETEISKKYPNSELYNNILLLAGKPEIEVINKDFAKDHPDENIKFPTQYCLLDNYPNPFNPATRIRYQIAENVKVNIKVYNMCGQEVATLINEFKEKGYHSVSWDARSYSSGIYYYRMIAGTHVETKKMLLLK